MAASSKKSGAPASPAALWKRLHGSPRLLLIAGPCVIESEELCVEIAGFLQKLCAKLDIEFIFKASYDKANRTSGKAFRGPGLADGLAVLERIRTQLGVPVITSDRSSTREVAGDAAVLIDPESEASITAALLRVGRDATLRAELSGRSLERARCFTWAAMARGVIELVDRVARSAPTP